MNIPDQNVDLRETGISTTSQIAKILKKNQNVKMLYLSSKQSQVAQLLRKPWKQTKILMHRSLLHIRCMLKDTN